MTTDPAPVFDFETYLKSDVFASLYNANKRTAAIQRTTGSLSTFASICIIVHILQSHHGLSTTYHRLVFGLSIADILFSFIGFVLGGIMAPKEYGYFVPDAMGNQASCDAQGFLHHFGGGMGVSYNMSICIYYLYIVTFNKTDDYIQIKIEPWLHGISILIILAVYLVVFSINGYNSYGNQCWFIPNILPHCQGIESGGIRNGFTIPCGRGDGKEHPTLYRFLEVLPLSIILLTPVVIVVTMALMYHTVRKAEKKMQKYGIGALRLRKNAANNHLRNNTNGNNSTSSDPSASHEENSGNQSQFSLIQWLKANFRKIPCMSSYCSSEHSNLRTTRIASQKRVILHRAVGYFTAWGLSWIPYFLFFILGVNGEAMGYIFVTFLPLQGVFTFFAYMLPKVRNAKKGPTKKRLRMNHVGTGTNGSRVNAVTWCQAFMKAYMSRGPKKTSGRHRTRTNGSSNGTCCWSNTPKALKKKLRTLISALSLSEPSMNKNIVQQPQEIRPPSPTSAQHNNDYKTPAPTTLERNVYTSPPPLVLSKVADDLKEEGEGDSEERHLSNNEDMGDVLDGVYLSKEIQSILE